MRTKRRKPNLPKLYPLLCGKCGASIFENGKPKPCPNGHPASKYEPEGERG